MRPPDGSIIGEQIQIEGIEKNPIEVGNRAAKCLDRISKDIKVGKDNIACYLEAKWSTSAGFVTSAIPGRVG